MKNQTGNQSLGCCLSHIGLLLILQVNISLLLKDSKNLPQSNGIAGVKTRPPGFQKVTLVPGDKEGRQINKTCKNKR